MESMRSSSAISLIANTSAAPIISKGTSQRNMRMRMCCLKVQSILHGLVPHIEVRMVTQCAEYKWQRNFMQRRNMLCLLDHLKKQGRRCEWSRHFQSRARREMDLRILRITWKVNELRGSVNLIRGGTKRKTLPRINATWMGSKHLLFHLQREERRHL